MEDQYSKGAVIKKSHLTKKVFWFLFGVIFFLAFIGGILYYFELLNLSKNTELTTDAPSQNLVSETFTTANDQVQSGNYDGAIETLATVNKTSLTKNQEATMLSLNAAALFRRNQNEDRQDSFIFYKQLAEGEDYPPQSRARAYADMAYLSRITLYSEPEARHYLPGSIRNAENPLEAINELYVKSDLMYANDFAKIGSLTLYTTDFYSTVPPIFKGEGDADIVRGLLDALTMNDSNIENTVDSYGAERATEMYSTRALAMSALNLTNEDFSYGDLNAAYASAVDAATYGGSTLGTEAIARIYHATFVLNRKIIDDVPATVASILAPLGNMQVQEDSDICNYYRAVRDDGEFAFAKNTILNITDQNLSPELVSFLAQCGWDV